MCLPLSRRNSNYKSIFLNGHMRKTASTSYHYYVTITATNAIADHFAIGLLLGATKKLISNGRIVPLDTAKISNLLNTCL